MAILNKTAFKALYGASGSTFPNNTTELIEEGDFRDQGEDIADSYMSISDNFIDEDSFASDSATKAPSQQSTRAYIAAQISATLSGLAWKSSVLCATTANITLSGLQTIDGIFAGGGSRVLVKNQSTASQNGIYVTGAGAWVRATDNDSTSEMQNAVVSVDQGTTNADTSWRQTTDSVTIGSSNVVWTSFGASAGAASESSAGIAEIATQAEANTGTDDARFVTPLKLKNVLLNSEQVFDTDLKFYEQDDFLYHNVAPLNARWQNANPLVSGTLGVDTTENAIGVGGIETTTSTTGVGYIAKSNLTNVYLLGGGAAYKVRFRAAMQNLSDGTDTFTVRIGLHDLPSAAGNGTDGAFFRYTHSVNGGRWEAVTISGGVETAEDTGVSPSAGVYQILDVRVNAAGTQVDFYINGALTNDITTNIPTGASNLTNIAAKIQKTAGTTSRFLYFDWYDLLITRTTAR